MCKTLVWNHENNTWVVETVRVSQPEAGARSCSRRPETIVIRNHGEEVEEDGDKDWCAEYQLQHQESRSRSMCRMSRQRQTRAMHRQ